MNVRPEMLGIDRITAWSLPPFVPSPLVDSARGSMSDYDFVASSGKLKLKGVAEGGVKKYVSCDSSAVWVV